MFSTTDEVFVLARKGKKSKVLQLNLDQVAKNNLLEGLDGGYSEHLSYGEEEREKIPFQVGYNLEDDEIFALDNYPLIDDIKSAIDMPHLLEYYVPSAIFGSTSDGFELKAVFVGTKVDDKYYAAFQKFEKRNVLKKTRGFLFYNGNTFKEMDNKNTLALDEKVNCIFIEGSLLFFDYKEANKIFDLSEYYRVATQHEINRFKESDQFYIADDATCEKLTKATMTRKKIAKILDSGVLDNYTALELKTKADELNIDIVLDSRNSKIAMPTNSRKMKELLSFLCEQVYKGAITGTKYVSNSTRTQE